MYKQAFHSTDLKSLKFLVTGGAGFIGSHLVEYLLQFEAAEVVVLDNFFSGHHHNIDPHKEHPAFRLIEGDIRDADTCRKACKGIDLVFHQAAVGSVPRSFKDPITSTAVNVDGFVNMLQAAVEQKVSRMVYASSSSVYGDEKSLPKMEDKIGDPLSPYAASKLTNENYAGVYARSYDIDLIGLRYFNVFGPRQDPKGPYAAVIPIFVDHILMGNSPFIDGDGGQTRDFTYIENVIQANIKAGFVQDQRALNRVYNVAYGENYTVQHLFDQIADMVGSDVEARYRETRVGDVRDSLASIDRARDLLGYEPEYNFKDGLKLTIDFFKSRLHTKPQ